MNDVLTKIKEWISDNFQYITIGSLVLLIFLVLKQQEELNELRSSVKSSKFRIIRDVESKIDDVESNLSSKIDDVESNLSSEIDGVRRTVIRWSN